MKRSITALIVLSAVLCGCAKPEVKTETYTVSSGDTLWSIASEYCPSNMDKRDYISELIKLNNIQNCTVYPNRSIQVIVYY
ncbi:MAG: LysM peptidoglycan-binding domain-containing protein [Oscillospiraceae bacterium]|nr:LysM peptidoglycan-binding domain-containing protein [Oscillospiraceae bacterium]